MSLQHQPRCLQQVKGSGDREAEGGESGQICKGLVYSNRSTGVPIPPCRSEAGSLGGLVRVIIESY